jgi:hypothetical protein
MTSNKFTKSIKYPGEVVLITLFVDFLRQLGIIGVEAAEDYESHIHDELSICPDCEQFMDECDCRHPRYREYDDEASFE